MTEKLTLGKLVMQTARGDVKERTLTPAEFSEIIEHLSRTLEPKLAALRLKYHRGPFEFREPINDSDAPYVYDADGGIVAMLMWPLHPVEETDAAEQETYAIGRAIAAALSNDSTTVGKPSGETAP